MFTDSLIIVSFIFKQINKSFSGGQPSTELQNLHGGNCDIDVAYQYLEFFCENDTDLAEIRDDYTKGTLLNGNLKIKSYKQVKAELLKYQSDLKTVSEDVVHKGKTSRRLKYNTWL